MKRNLTISMDEDVVTALQTKNNYSGYINDLVRIALGNATDATIGAKRAAAMQKHADSLRLAEEARVLEREASEMELRARNFADEAQARRAHELANFKDSWTLAHTEKDKADVVLKWLNGDYFKPFKFTPEELNEVVKDG